MAVKWRSAKHAAEDACAGRPTIINGFLKKRRQDIFWLFGGFEGPSPAKAAKVNFEMLLTRRRLFLEGDVSRKSEMSDLPAGSRLNAIPSVRSLRHPEH